MQIFNKNDYVNFTISGNGWTLTVSTFEKASRQWDNLTSGTLYGNKPNGTREIIASK